MSGKYSIRGGSCSRIVIVMDTSALLAKYYLNLPDYLGEIIIPERVLEEVRDEESRRSLELGLGIKRISVGKPSRDAREKIKEAAERIGEYISLSEADLDVVALAYMYKERGCKVIVFTDDYSIQNLLAHLEISFKPLRTRGIRDLRIYKVYCPVCGYVSFNPGEEICPICGSRLIRKIVSRRQL